jgi:nicotinamidase-related amidase
MFCFLCRLGLNRSVRATALSALNEGFSTTLLTSATRAVGGQEAAQKVYDELQTKGATIITDL